MEALQPTFSIHTYTLIITRQTCHFIIKNKNKKAHADKTVIQISKRHFNPKTKQNKKQKQNKD